MLTIISESLTSSVGLLRCQSMQWCFINIPIMNGCVSHNLCVAGVVVKLWMFCELFYFRPQLKSSMTLWKSSFFLLHVVYFDLYKCLELSCDASPSQGGTCLNKSCLKTHSWLYLPALCRQGSALHLLYYINITLLLK